MKFNFKYKTVVITGGASGIGLSTAKAFSKAGATVFILGRDQTKLKAAKAQIKNSQILSIDVSKIESVTKAFKKIGKIDVLVNCAGIYGPIGQFHENDLKHWQEAIVTNLFGTVSSCYAALPIMLKNGAGKIINLSGGGAVQPFPNFSAYATSKVAVVRFTENLAKEYEKQNIQINCIAPGAINTKFLDQVLQAGVKKVGKDFFEKSLAQKTSGGDSPELAAELILFLASQKNKLSGRIVSAKWDDWQKWDNKKIKQINNSQDYTLRRIDNKYFKSVK